MDAKSGTLMEIIRLMVAVAAIATAAVYGILVVIVVLEHSSEHAYAGVRRLSCPV